MKKSWIRRTLLAVLTLALAVGLLGAYGVAQAAVDSVSISYDSSQRLTLAVGEEVTLNANPTRSGDTTLDVAYSWEKSNANVDLANDTTAACTVTGSVPGTTRVTVTVSDAETPGGKTNYVDITVTNASITGAPTSAMSGGATKQLYVTGVNAAAANTWEVTDNSTNVITVDANGLVTATGAGTKTVKVTSTYNGKTVTASVNISVNASISISPATGNINSLGGTKDITLAVDYGGALFANANVTWSSGNTWLATVDKTTEQLDTNGRSTVKVTANTVGYQGEVVITAKVRDINGTDHTYTSTLQIRTAGYFALDYYPTNRLSKTGNTIVVMTYTAYNADGTVNTGYNGYASWSWTTNLLQLSANSINNYRHQFNNGVATMELQTRGYNTRSSGSPVYAWIDGQKSATRLSKQIYVTGYANIIQTGQDFTPVYVLGACCLAVAAVWVVWYAKKKRTAAR